MSEKASEPVVPARYATRVRMNACERLCVMTKTNNFKRSIEYASCENSFHTAVLRFPSAQALAIRSRLQQHTKEGTSGSAGGGNALDAIKNKMKAKLLEAGQCSCFSSHATYHRKNALSLACMCNTLKRIWRGV
jgi:hypothetical protein